MLKACGYSLSGLWAIFKSEESFRLDVLLCLVLVSAAFALDFDAVQKCVLIIPAFMLLVAEILNSAIEKCVDMFTENYNPLAKFAKDAGSAAVFVCLVCIFVCWITVLYSKYA